MCSAGMQQLQSKPNQLAKIRWHEAAGCFLTLVVRTPFGESGRPCARAKKPSFGKPGRSLQEPTAMLVYEIARLLSVFRKRFQNSLCFYKNKTWLSWFSWQCLSENMLYMCEHFCMPWIRIDNCCARFPQGMRLSREIVVMRSAGSVWSACKMVSAGAQS